MQIGLSWKVLKKYWKLQPATLEKLFSGQCPVFLRYNFESEEMDVGLEWVQTNLMKEVLKQAIHQLNAKAKS